MIEFPTVQGPPPVLDRHVVVFPIVKGISEALTAELASYVSWAQVDYTTYVDTMTPTAVPQLVAIITGERVEAPE